MSQAVIFAGPTIGAHEVLDIAPFACRPPAAQGDIYRAVTSGAKAIGLIDGYFEGVPAVWHKEILFAMASGVHVFGSSSMGALRAAELHSYGMRGIGRIFEWYVDGTIDADDDVALAHAPAEIGYAQLSVPLVNVRATLENAVQNEVIPHSAAERLLSSARAIYFKERTWATVVREPGLDGIEAQSFLRWVRVNAIDQKKADARVMVETMALLTADWPGPFRAAFAFERTDAWDSGVAVFVADPGLSEADRLVLDEARIHLDNFDHLLAVAAATVSAADGTGGGRGRSRHVDRFRSERGLQNLGAFRDWLSANALSEEDVARHLAGRAAVAGLADRQHTLLTTSLLAEIKLRGLYPELKRLADRKTTALAKAGGVGHATGDQPLIEWFYGTRLKQSIPDDLEAARRRLGLASWQEFRELMLREYLTGLRGSD